MANSEARSSTKSQMNRKLLLGCMTVASVAGFTAAIYGGGGVRSKSSLAALSTLSVAMLGWASVFKRRPNENDSTEVIKNCMIFLKKYKLI